MITVMLMIRCEGLGGECLNSISVPPIMTREALRGIASNSNWISYQTHFDNGISSGMTVVDLCHECRKKAGK